MSNIWHVFYCDLDKAWILATSACNILSQHSTQEAAVEAMLKCQGDPDSYDRFMAWQHASGRRLMAFSRDRLHWKRKREESHGPPIPPFEEF